MRRRLRFGEFARDLRIALRSLARQPGLSATIVLTVGIGLGAASGMISVVRAVLLAPLPYADPAALVWIYTDNPPYRFRFSRVDYLALEADHPAFSAIAAYETSSVTVADGDAAERVTRSRSPARTSSSSVSGRTSGGSLARPTTATATAWRS